MTEYDFTQTIYTPQLLDEMNTAGLPAPSDIETDGTAVQIFYSDALTDDQQATLAAVVANHVANPAYVTLTVQASIATLTGYLNNANATIANTARAVMIANLAPRMPPDLLTTINSAIAAKLGG